MADSKNESRTVESRDGCVVETDALAGVLREFVSDWNAERPASSGEYEGSGSNVPPVGAVTWLTQEVGRIDPRVTRSVIENIAYRRSERYRPKFVEHRVADSLLTAMGRTDVLHMLEVKPNPRASRAARAGCCGTRTPMPPWSLASSFIPR